jgi:arsenate reductase
LLDEHGIDHTYRDYRSQPLSVDELRTIFTLLGVGPKDLLRRRDRAFRALSLAGDEDDETLIGLMHEHPTLLERPIGVLKDRAVVARPPENLLQLATT